MRRLLLIIPIIFISFLAQAQDYIVTIKGDTFECKITKISERFIHFDYQVGDETRSTVILLDQVNTYDRGSGPNQTPKTQNSAEKAQKPNDDFPTYNDQYEENMNKYVKANKKQNDAIYRLSVFGGYSYLTGKGSTGLSPDLQAYEDEIRSGAHFGASFLYFPKIDKAGYGLRLNSFSSSNSGTFSFFDPDLNEEIIFDVEDNINIIYVGPQISSRSTLGINESALLFGFSAGYVSYVNNGSAFNQTIRISGEGFGLMANMALDIQLTKGILLNLGVSYLVNSISKINVNGNIITLPDDELLNNSHVNLGAGLSFVFN